MKHARAQRLLVLALAVLGLATAYLLLSRRPPPETDPLPVARPLLETSLEELQSLTVDTGALLMLRRRGPQDPAADFEWILVGNESARLLRPEVARMLVSAADVEAQRSVAKDPSDLGLFGLAAPRARVTVTRRDRTSRTLLIGDRTPAGGTYAMLDGEPEVVVIDEQQALYLQRRPQELVDTSLPTFTVQLVQEFRLVRPGLEVAVAYQGFHDASQPAERAAFVFQAPYPAGTLVNPEAMFQILQLWKQNLTGDVADGFVAADDSDPGRLGFTNAAYLLEVTDADQVFCLTVGAPASATHRYARIDGVAQPFLLGNSRVGVLERLQAADILQRRIVEVDWGLVEEFVMEAASASGGAARVALRRDGGSLTRNGALLPATTEVRVTGALQALRIDAPVPHPTPAATLKPLLTLTWVLSKPELPTAQVRLVAFDRDFAGLVLDGEVQFLIDRQAVAALIDLMVDLAAESAG